jgi:hypothetical protein
MGDYLPAVRKEDYLPVLREKARVLDAPGRLARLGSVLGLSAILLVVGGLAGWAIVGKQLAEGVDGRGPWPLVLAGAVCLGLVGAGCGFLALVFGRGVRRQAIGAVCLSLVAPLAVGIIALALFFASTTLSFGI